MRSDQIHPGIVKFCPCGRQAFQRRRGDWTCPACIEIEDRHEAHERVKIGTIYRRNWLESGPRKFEDNDIKDVDPLEATQELIATLDRQLQAA